ncbi:MAG: YheV family putative zinc ribbon protein [Ketobacteraceae bacterium]|nr:YheV family putative zinc ribbon protein [Ketobacteraceae bacterium]
MAARKRFIAGAVCPECRQQDKLYIEDDPTIARCNACGYEMTQPDEAGAPAESPGEQAVTLVNFDRKKDE